MGAMTLFCWAMVTDNIKRVKRGERILTLRQSVLVAFAFSAVLVTESRLQLEYQLWASGAEQLWVQAKAVFLAVPGVIGVLLGGRHRVLFEAAVQRELLFLLDGQVVHQVSLCLRGVLLVAADQMRHLRFVSEQR